MIPELRATLQSVATWWIHCHDSRATCHIAGCSHLAKSMSWSCHIARCKNSNHHIENCFSPYFIYFLFLMQFGLWRAATFVSSPIHLLLVTSASDLPLRTIKFCSVLFGVPYAAHWRDIDIAIIFCLSVRLSVCPSICASRSGIPSQRLNILSQFLHRAVPQSFCSFISIKHIRKIPTGSHPAGSLNTMGYKNFSIFHQ